MGIAREFVVSCVRGSKKDPSLQKIFKAHFTKHLFSQIYEAALIKRDGGTDNLGNSWKPLRPRTKAYNKPSLRKGLSLPGPKMRPTLTPQQNAAWKRAFMKAMAGKRSELSKGELARRTEGKTGRALREITKRFNRRRAQITAKLLGQLPDNEVESMAAAYAWNHVLELYGAETLMGLLGNSDSPILWETGALIESYKPGNPSITYRPRRNQLYRSTHNRVVIGSKLPYAGYHEDRPIIPPNIGPWANRAARRALQEVAKRRKS